MVGGGGGGGGGEREGVRWLRGMNIRAGYRYPVFIENRLLTFDRYTEPTVCVSNKISIHSLSSVKIGLC